MAVRALSSVKMGPPNVPACWPVAITTARGSARRAALARAGSGDCRVACWAASAAAIAARSRVWAVTRAIASRQAAGCAGLPAKAGATLSKALATSRLKGRAQGTFVSSTPMAGAPEAGDRVDGDGEA